MIHLKDIMDCDYRDPLELDDFSENNISDFGNDVETLFEGRLKESTANYLRKRKINMNEYDSEMEDTVQHSRKVVQKIKEPWTEDQAFVWPDYEARAFEQALESFRKRPESNTGYTNKALNDKMISWFGKQAKDCIDDKLFK